MVDDVSKFDLEIANVIWMKIKGCKIPEYYTAYDIKSIIERYWHRAMESEQ